MGLTMPTLSQIIEESANRMRDVTVHVVSNYGTVCISDDKGVQEDIFMQGDDASKFISERDELWNKVGNLSKGTIELYLAEPYVECFWN